MAKIIHLQNNEFSQNKSRDEEGFIDRVNWASDMKNLLQIIEKSLEDTYRHNAKYDTKDINSRR